MLESEGQILMVAFFSQSMIRSCLAKGGEMRQSDVNRSFKHYQMIFIYLHGVWEGKVPVLVNPVALALLPDNIYKYMPRVVHLEWAYWALLSIAYTKVWPLSYTWQLEKKYLALVDVVRLFSCSPLWYFSDRSTLGITFNLAQLHCIFNRIIPQIVFWLSSVHYLSLGRKDGPCLVSLKRLGKLLCKCRVDLLFSRQSEKWCQPQASSFKTGWSTCWFMSRIATSFRFCVNLSKACSIVEFSVFASTTRKFFSASGGEVTC